MINVCTNYVLTALVIIVSSKMQRYIYFLKAP